MIGTEAEWLQLGAPARAWWSHAYLSPEDARYWHDAAMSTHFAGYIPPVRPKVARTLKAPEFKSSPCQVCHALAALCRTLQVDADPHLPTVVLEL